MKLEKFIVLDCEGHQAEVFAYDEKQAVHIWNYAQTGPYAVRAIRAVSGEKPTSSRA